MNAAERMTALCADRCRQAEESDDTDAFEVWEDLEILFTQAAMALENEPESAVRPFMEGMSAALTDTASHAKRHYSPAFMAAWLAERDRNGETPGETCVYGDLMRFYDYLEALYGNCDETLNRRTAGALSGAAKELARLTGGES